MSGSLVCYRPVLFLEQKRIKQAQLSNRALDLGSLPVAQAGVKLL
jgi:hypothetical protein